MSILHVCAPAFYKTKYEARFLCRTADRVGINVGFFGLGTPWPGFVKGKIIGLRKYLDTVKQDIVLFVDANDSVLLTGEDGLLKAYEKARKGKDLVIQSDRHCFPYVCAKQELDRMAGIVPKYRYPCSGAIMGTTTAMMQALDELIRRYEEIPRWIPGREDDQGLWTIGIVNKFVDIAIDYESHLSICAYRCKLSWLELPGGGYGFDGNKTAILHFAGHARGAFDRYVALEGLGE